MAAKRSKRTESCGHVRSVAVVIRVIEDHLAASGSYNARYMGDLRCVIQIEI
jgi:hypothetical protein